MLSRKSAVAILIVLAILGVGVFVFFAARGKAPEIPKIEELKRPVSIKEVIGHSVEGREITAYTYGTGKTHLAFVGGIHGGYEWNSVLLAYSFLDYLTAFPDAVPDDVTIAVIPSANPDGVYKIIGKEGRFAPADAPSKEASIPGRFNAHTVDLNRNFDCKWKPFGTWKGNTVSAGTKPFSEPETEALRKFFSVFHPTAVIFWHSQANAVFASECTEGILPETRNIMNVYAKAASYPTVDAFDSYEVTGDAEGWLASIGIPAITVELQTHETVEWERNLLGIKALLNYFKGR